MYAEGFNSGQPSARRWRHWRRWPAGELPARVREMLLDQDSLTARLVDASAGAFAVRVLGQSWQRPLAGERAALGLRSDSRALVREVALACHGEPWVFARSVMPAGSLTGNLRHLRRFGSRSLGAMLFADPHLLRGDFELALIGPADPLVPAGLRGAHALWARRSVFRLRGKPLLVQEVFLPACRIGSAAAPVYSRRMP